MSAKIYEPILHVKGWVNGRIQLRSRGCTPGFPANFESQVPCGPGNRTGRPVRYLLDAIHISRQNCTTNTCTNSSIIIYPYPSFVQRNLRVQPPPRTAVRDGAHGYKPRREIRIKKHTISREKQRHWRIMTGIWQLKKGFIR